MPPKKDTAGGESAKGILTGWEDKETKLLAAAFLSSVGPDKYDYDIMAKLTGNTAGSLKKMWPPVKKKAIDAHPSFATFLGLNSSAATATAAPVPTADPKAAAPKAKGGRKRKADPDADEGDKGAATDTADNKSGDDKKKTSATKPKGRAAKKVKSEEVVKEEVKEEEDSADGGDGLEPTKEVEEEV